MTSNPGSEAARKAGCQCPVIDNGHGRGYRGQPGVFVYNAECPVHGKIAAGSPSDDARSSS